MKKIIFQAKSGNKKAFDKIYEETSAELLRYCMHLCKNENDARDLMQDTYFTAFSKIEYYKKDDNFRGWLHTIAVHKYLNTVRADRIKTEPEADPDDVSDDENCIPENALQMKETAGIIREVLYNSLSDSQRAAVMMYYYDELSVSEISEALECPEGTVKSRLFSSRKIMRDELERKGIKSGIAAFAISAVLKSDIEVAETVECSVVKKGVSKAAAVKIFSGVSAAVLIGGGIAAEIFSNKDNDLCVEKEIYVTSAVTSVSEAGTSGMSRIVSETSVPDSDVPGSEHTEFSPETKKSELSTSEPEKNQAVSEIPEDNNTVAEIQTGTAALTSAETQVTLPYTETVFSGITAETEAEDIVPVVNYSFDAGTMYADIPENFTADGYRINGNKETGYSFSKLLAYSSIGGGGKFSEANEKQFYVFKPDNISADKILFTYQDAQPDEVDALSSLEMFFTEVSLNDREDIVIKNDNTVFPDQPSERSGYVYRYSATDYNVDITGEVIVFRGNYKTTHVIIVCDGSGRWTDEYRKFRESIGLVSREISEFYQ